MYATFVVPAPNGCNLKCAYCAVAHRKEAIENRMTDSHYIQFLKAALYVKRPKQVSVVGYEPTLDVAVELTLMLLYISKQCGVATSMNTNGLNLPKHIKRFAPALDRVMISLDSSIGVVNDRMRGLMGTFAGTTEGITRAVEMMGPERVVVNTLLTPNKAERISGMPDLLKRLGVRNWVISPYIDFGKGILKPDIEFIRAIVRELADKAHASGITAHYADEFRQIGVIDGVPLYNFQRPGEPDEFVFRLAPNGSCSVGDEILTDSAVAQVWDGKERAVTFLRSLIAAHR